MSPLALLAFGFALGMRHATDPDHVIAVSTIVSRERTLRAAAPIGLSWGFGHTATVAAAGTMILAWNLVIPPRIGLVTELVVALMLVALGVINLRARARGASSNHGGLPHDDHPHHSHHHRERVASEPRRWSVRSLLIGMVHGLAGSAAVALLAMATVSSVAWGIAYLAVFGAGTIAGMMLVTLAMALPLLASTRRLERIQGALIKLTGLASVLFGLFLVYEIGFVRGLFDAHPIWVPA